MRLSILTSAHIGVKDCRQPYYYERLAMPEASKARNARLQVDK